MQLQIDKEKCENCASKNCIKECPKSLPLEAFECMHCLPEKALCKKACAYDAIEEIAEGVLAVNEKKCRGCGKCKKACQHNAMILANIHANEKARKCDLCAGKGFETSCMKACGENAIKLKEGETEIKGIEKALGWRIIYIKENGFALREDDERIISQTGGEKFYAIKNIPQLTLQEALLLKKALEEFQIKNEKKTKLFEFLKNFLKKNSIKLSEEQERYFFEILKNNISGFGILDSLLKDDELEEICLIGLGKENPLRVYHRVFGWLKTNAYFSSEETARNLINKMARESGRRLSLKTPNLNAVLPNGSRLNASIKPIAFSGINFTIRKFKTNPFTPLELLQNETVSAEILAFLWLSLQSDLSIIICGNTGSGKTSTLNALFSFIPSRERIIITEETPELVIPQEHVIKLNTCDEISMQELIIETLRMRPDRVIVGEIRNKEEVKSFVDTMLAGQGKGSFATFHAVSAQECINRLKALGVNENELNSLDLVIVQKRWDEIDLMHGTKKEVRKIVEITEYHNNALNELFSFDFKKKEWIAKNESKKVFVKLQKSFRMNEKELKEEIFRRTRLLEKLELEKFSLQEFFEFVNKFEENKTFREKTCEKKIYERKSPEEKIIKKNL